MAAVENGGKWGFIDTKGEWVIPADFKDAKDFNNGIAIVQKDKEWVYIDKKEKFKKILHQINCSILIMELLFQTKQ